jgi:hypothetical protein
LLPAPPPLSRTAFLLVEVLELIIFPDPAKMMIMMTTKTRKAAKTEAGVGCGARS